MPALIPIESGLPRNNNYRELPRERGSRRGSALQSTPEPTERSPAPERAGLVDRCANRRAAAQVVDRKAAKAEAHGTHSECILDRTFRRTD
jgi:hypothetical protein